MKKVQGYKILIAAFASLMLIGCGGGGGGTTVSGKVTAYATGAALSGVTVKSGSDSVTTGNDGKYSISVSGSQNSVNISFSKTGYVSTTKTAVISSDSQSNESVDVQMLKISTSKDFGAGEAIVLNDGTAQVSIPANSLEQDGGTPPEYPVTVGLTTINPAADIRVMPGDMTTSSGDPIESYGAIAVELTDKNGNKLDLEEGKSATIRIPAVTRNGAAMPATIDLYYFDEESGSWKKEGTATLKGAAPNQYYEGTVNHFSIWNADILYPYVLIKGCVEDVEGNKIKYASIEMTGKDYSGKAFALSDNEGNFSVRAKENATSLVYARKNNKASNTKQVTTGSYDKVLDECLIIGDMPLTVKLTWGLNPIDLDTHVKGPGGFHIWYSHKGTYADDGAELDVDDVTSYGPEVFTVRKLNAAGTYHYAVHHYAGAWTRCIRQSLECV